MKPYLLIIRTRVDARRMRVRMVHALARCSADALLGVMDQLPVGALVTVRPA